MSDDGLPDDPVADDALADEVTTVRVTEGAGILRASVVGTAVFTVVAIGAVLTDVIVPLLVVVSLVLFAAGVVAFLVAFARAVERSRYEAIGMGGLFFLVGSAPGRVQLLLLGSLLVEVVVAFVAASIRIYTPVAFGLLVPMYGLGLAGLWASRHGRFGPRQSAEDGGDGGDGDASGRSEGGDEAGPEGRAGGRG